MSIDLKNIKMKRILLVFLLLQMLCLASKAEIISNVKYNGKTYYVDVLKTTTGNVAKVELWLRISNIATSVGDLKVFELSGKTKSLAEYTDLVCRGKTVMDAGKTILGCASVVGSVFCAAATIASDGALAFVCETTWNFAIDYGAAACLEGSADAIATYLGKQKEWKLLGTAAQLTDPKLIEAISSAIDFMCEDVKKKKD
ncbi:MAG: hypothetical protein J7578_22940 [Chitinophagaceae bacterium]|nr:hypothetical protein [Chitinophagaceae bacterium]